MSASGSSSEEEEELNEAQREVRQFKADRKRVKAKMSSLNDEDDEEDQRRDSDPDDVEDDDGDDDDEGGNGYLYEQRADGTKKVKEVFGEEGYKRQSVHELEMEMGTKLEPFNLTNERENGHFDESGSYVERNFNHSRDAWLDDLDEQNSKAIGGSRKKFIKQQHEEDAAGEEEAVRPPSAGETASMVAELQSLLASDQETVTEAIKRLAAERKARQTKPREKKSSDPLFARPVARAVQRADEDAFDRVTTLADLLLSLGNHSVYSFRQKDFREILLAKKRTAKIWKYRLAGPESEVFGPFSGNDMSGWQQQGYFAAPQVEICITIGPKKNVFRPATEVDFDGELEKLN